MNIFRGIFNFFYEIFLGCSHDRLTRPFTLEQQTYKVCLDCGSQIYYSPVTMKQLSKREVRRMKAVRSGEVRVMSPAQASQGAAVIREVKRESNAA